MSCKAQSMNICLHEVAERFVHHAMSFQRVRPGEPLRHDPHVKVTSTIPSAGMPDVLPAFVRDLELVRRKGRFESRSNGGNSVAVHGSVCRTGLISTSANTPWSR